MANHSIEHLSPAQLPSETPIDIAVHRYEGDDRGPTVYIQAAQHGREIGGTEALRRLHDELVSASIAGEVITVPVANPLTFDQVSYTTPEELDRIQPNMNRVWPGDSNGTLHEKMAASLWSIAEDADAVIDLHTASGKTLPHIVHTKGDEKSESLADAFGTDLLLAESFGDEADEEWHSRGFSGKFRVAAFKAGLPCITPELGDSNRLDESGIKIGLTGILNVLKFYDILSGKPTENGRALKRKNHLGRITANESGIFCSTFDGELGATVDEGDKFGYVYAPQTYETLQEVVAEENGILYALTEEATVTAGDRLVSIAVPRDKGAE